MYIQENSSHFRLLSLCLWGTVPWDITVSSCLLRFGLCLKRGSLYDMPSDLVGNVWVFIAVPNGHTWRWGEKPALVDIIVITLSLSPYCLNTGITIMFVSEADRERQMCSTFHHLYSSLFYLLSSHKEGTTSNSLPLSLCITCLSLSLTHTHTHTHTHITGGLLTSSSHIVAHSLPFLRTAVFMLKAVTTHVENHLCSLALLAENECHVVHWFAVGSISKNLKTGWDDWLTSHRKNLPHLNSTDWIDAGEEKRWGEVKKRKEWVCGWSKRDAMSCIHTSNWCMLTFAN